VTQIASANSISQQSLVQQQHQQQQVLSSSPVLQLQNAQAAQAVAAQQAAAQHAAAQQAQAYPSGISEQNYGGTTYFIPENQKQTHVICGPPYMAFPGVSTDTSVAYLERTIQMKVNARASFFVGEEYRQHVHKRWNDSQATLASEDGPTKREHLLCF
jgi:hypothetical protein